MKDCPWESIDDFRSLIEFERFEKWISQQVYSGDAIETKVTSRYLGTVGGFDEKWYRHVDSGQVWRLVWPDFPFTGLFEQVT